MKKFNHYPLDTFGIWDIYGEDPNCDIMGHHHEPFLDRVKGTYGDAIQYAFSLSNFAQWGGGGKITKYEPMEVKDITGFADDTIYEELKELEDTRIQFEKDLEKTKKAIEERERLIKRRGKL